MALELTPAEYVAAARERHSIRQYSDRQVESEKLAQLQKAIDRVNQEADLHIQMVTNEPSAFDSKLAHYGSFRGVQNYFALVGKKANDLDERLGYYGEQLVLLARHLGLDSCWVGLTFSKKKDIVKVGDDEKFVAVITFGYADGEPKHHKRKTFDQVTESMTTVPDWFRRGVDCALQAPTAVNQQKFKIGLHGEQPTFRVSGVGFFTKVDLGIVRFHFEVGRDAM